LLWVGNAARPELGLAAPPGPALFVGGALGVGAIPVYALGYRAAAALVAGASPRAARIASSAGGSASFLGAAIHGATAWQIAQSPGSTLDPLAATLESPLLVVLWSAATLLVLVASVAFALAALRARERALALANPALVTVLLGALGRASLWLQAFLAPAAPNLAHLAFFTACALASGRRAEGVR
jgi:hypothetical protein